METLDLSLLPERRRKPIVERWQRETVAVLAKEMYPKYREAYGWEEALERIQQALVADGFPRRIATLRLIRGATREGR